MVMADDQTIHWYNWKDDVQYIIRRLRKNWRVDDVRTSIVLATIPDLNSTLFLLGCGTGYLQ